MIENIISRLNSVPCVHTNSKRQKKRESERRANRFETRQEFHRSSTAAAAKAVDTSTPWRGFNSAKRDRKYSLHVLAHLNEIVRSKNIQKKRTGTILGIWLQIRG